MRCCNNCATCFEDCQGQDVLMVGLHNTAGDKEGMISRNGTKCCWSCDLQCPMKCHKGCFFYCTTCDCACTPFGGAKGITPCGGCCNRDFCDPVCCLCCTR